MSYFTYSHYQNLAASGGYQYTTLSPSNATAVYRVNVASQLGPIRADIRYGVINSQVNIAALYTSAENRNASFELPPGFMLDNTTLFQVTITNNHTANQDAHLTIQHSD